MTAGPDTLKTTKQNRIVRVNPKLKKLIIKKMRSRYYTIEANYWQTRSIAQPVCDSRAIVQLQISLRRWHLSAWNFAWWYMSVPDRSYFCLLGLNSGHLTANTSKTVSDKAVAPQGSAPPPRIEVYVLLTHLFCICFLCSIYCSACMGDVGRLYALLSWPGRAYESWLSLQ